MRWHTKSTASLRLAFSRNDTDADQMPSSILLRADELIE